MLLKTQAIAALTALSLSLSAAAPAHALGKNERKFLQGIAAAVVVGAIVNETRKARRKPAPAPQPVYRERPKAPQAHYYQPEPETYKPKRKTGRIIGKTNPYSSGIAQTTAARVFNSYTRSERQNIQRNLARFGYYRGAIDGTFGPGTHQAVFEFARTAGKQDALNSTSGTYQVYDALLG